MLMQYGIELSSLLVLEEGGNQRKGSVEYGE
jgi:hypothetical protein